MVVKGSVSWPSSRSSTCTHGPGFKYRREYRKCGLYTSTAWERSISAGWILYQLPRTSCKIRVPMLFSIDWLSSCSCKEMASFWSFGKLDSFHHDENTMIFLVDGIIKVLVEYEESTMLRHRLIWFHPAKCVSCRAGRSLSFQDPGNPLLGLVGTWVPA